MYSWELQGRSVPLWEAAINSLKIAKTLCHIPSMILARKPKEAGRDSSLVKAQIGTEHRRPQRWLGS